MYIVATVILLLILGLIWARISTVGTNVSSLEGKFLALKRKSGYKLDIAEEKFLEEHPSFSEDLEKEEVEELDLTKLYK